MQRQRPFSQTGVTLIELMVVVALIAIVLVLVAPSFQRLIEYQRVVSTNAMLVTDLQLARSEAATRGARVRITFAFDATKTCYTIYTYQNAGVSCDCLQSSPCAAAGAGYTEIKTTRVPLDKKVYVFPDLSTPDSHGNETPWEFAFEPLAGGLYTIPLDVPYDVLQTYTIRTFIDGDRELHTIVGLSGRPTVCAPAGSKMRERAC